MKKFFLLLMLVLINPKPLLAVNAAQSLKNRAAAARATQAAANAVKYNALITRMTSLLTAAADKGEERYLLPATDADFKDWSSQVGIEYLTAPARGFEANVVNYSNGQALEISWVVPRPET